MSEYRHDPDERFVVQLTVGQVQDLQQGGYGRRLENPDYRNLNPNDDGPKAVRLTYSYCSKVQNSVNIFSLGNVTDL